jgi:uncharacterized protein (TIGR02001 family)
MKRLPVLLAATTIAASAHAAESEFQFPVSVDLTSNYVFRGISQTDNGPAIQGSFGVTHSSGLYVGLWASNVDFNDNNQANLETDWSAGLTGKIGGLGWDLGAIYYYYPGAASSLNYNYWEIGPKLSYDLGFASTTFGFYASPNFFGDTGTGWYPYLEASIPLPLPMTQKVNLGLHVGHQNVEAQTFTNYTDWRVGLSTQLAGLGFDLSYIDTSLSQSECGNTTLCGSRAVFTVSKSF